MKKFLKLRNYNQSIFESIKNETLNYSFWFNAKDHHQNVIEILERYIQNIKDKSNRIKVNVYNCSYKFLNSLLAPIVQGIHTLQLTDWGDVDEWKEKVWDISIFNGIKNIGSICRGSKIGIFKLLCIKNLRIFGVNNDPLSRNIKQKKIIIKK